MGRELKRVALDFSWPINKVWKGYINPHNVSKPCPFCENGYSPEYTKLHSLWYSHLGGGFKPEDRGSTPYLPTDPLVIDIITRKINRDERAASFYGTDGAAIHREAVRMCQIWNSAWSHHLNDDDVKALVKADRLMDFTHTCKSGEGWKKKKNFKMPTAKEVNDWSLESMGHDSINCWVVLDAECKRLGYKTSCECCKGHGHLWPSKKAKKTYDDWKDFEPPSGKGYQIWETVSEGSPVSPVFSTSDALANWMVNNDDSVTRGTTWEGWMKFIEGAGWAPSMVSVNGVMKSGVEAISDING